VEDLVTCRNSFVARWPETDPHSLITDGEVSFVDETTVRVTANGSTEVVRFDARTLRADRTITLQYCPSNFVRAPS
jgi:hypothetical protein